VFLESPDVEGVSLVGSTAVGKDVYARAAAHGKRAQCQTGAKNFMVVMPDADMDRTAASFMTSFFGTAGQRCLAGAVALPVGEAYEPLREKVVEAASALKVGYGMDETVDVGPLITKEAKQRVLRYIEEGVEQGAKLILDGRGIQVEGFPNGYFVGPTIFDEVQPEMTIAQEEIFGPVMSIVPGVEDLDQAIDIIHANRYGNAASIFTKNGKYAREFQYRVECGNIGVNVGIVAPMAYFPFGGYKESFYGDLHGQGRDAINFFTERKVVITRWW
jgi:malonate-semialdehyde dehydrogenase (acetylating)/methylmalonate-semialdehyde dehydrogenase